MTPGPSRDVLLLGATGSAGRGAARAFALAGHGVTAVLRPGSPVPPDLAGAAILRAEAAVPGAPRRGDRGPPLRRARLLPRLAHRRAPRRLDDRPRRACGRAARGRARRHRPLRPGVRDLRAEAPPRVPARQARLRGRACGIPARLDRRAPHDADEVALGPGRPRPAGPPLPRLRRRAPDGHQAHLGRRPRPLPRRLPHRPLEPGPRPAHRRPRPRAHAARPGGHPRRASQPPRAPAPRAARAPVGRRARWRSQHPCAPGSPRRPSSSASATTTRPSRCSSSTPRRAATMRTPPPRPDAPPCASTTQHFSRAGLQACASTPSSTPRERPPRPHRGARHRGARR